MGKCAAQGATFTSRTSTSATECWTKISGTKGSAAIKNLKTNPWVLARGVRSRWIVAEFSGGMWALLVIGVIGCTSSEPGLERDATIVDAAFDTTAPGDSDSGADASVPVPCDKHSPALELLAADVRSRGGVVVVGSPGDEVRGGPRWHFDSAYSSVYIAFDHVAGTLTVLDDLDADTASPMDVMAPSAQPYYSTPAGEPYPEPLSIAIDACLVPDHELLLGAPLSTNVYFLVPEPGWGWLMLWRTTVEGGRVDSDATHSEDGVSIEHPVPIDRLRLPPAP